ncbi:MAG TPA: prolyl oligopeptidase family serine peptidase [Chitinophagaceae bacterium]|nr:prolyl oligopeptidase family serine peptidase [Chitinophagaceae bacterium]
MQTKRIATVAAIAFLLIAQFSKAQTDGSYQLPPKDIADMLLAKPTPNVSIDEKAQWMLFLQYNSYPSVEELARPELRIAGMRINPANFSPSRQSFINDLYLKEIASGKEFKITGLPSPLFAGNVSWSPNEKKIAFTQTTNDKVDLYVVDVAAKKAMKVNKEPLNVLVAGSYEWYDDITLLYRVIIKPASAAPPKPLMPKGVTVQENIGKAIPRPTFEDLIKSPYDEELFEFYATSQLVKNVNGVETKISSPAIYSSINISPDKKYMIIRKLKKPFSYAVPAQGFASTVAITDMTGRTIKQLADLPSSETAPSGNDNVQFVPRDFDWRDDEPATVTWCMPLDSGFIKKNMAYHDEVIELKAPFTGEPAELFKTKMRFRNIIWGTPTLSLVNEGLTGKQTTQLDRFNPSTGTLEILITRNTTDAYSNPGFPVTEKNQWDRDVIKVIDNGNKILMNNSIGASPKGDLPFLASFDLNDKKLNIEWRSDEDHFENVIRVVDFNKGLLITRRESEKEMPNYYMRDLRNKDMKQLTSFANPYPQLDGVSKEKIHYKRADGVDLTGDLYLPKGFDPKKDKPLPVFIWAYPAEYNSAADAAQVRGSEHHFTLINWASPIFYVTQGYAVLNNAEMPIVSLDKSKKPNDDFVNQLTMNAEAAINKLVEMGVGDRDRVAVGGHSYGAFMTANLLAHTKLFKAGIARSGAYNRSLTPFGFQNEDRTYWDDPKLYYDMSPFSFANQIKTPLLLIHGDADDNTGTFPIQSERLFDAIKGFGGTVRYVSLPYEAHGYRGKENLLQMLYEQNQWLDKYVKNADKNEPRKEQKAF